MINNNILARIFYSLGRLDKMYEDYLKWGVLTPNEKKAISDEFDMLSREETPALALKRHGTIPPEKWQEITDEMRKRHSKFLEKHPHFYLNPLIKELRSIVEASDVTFKNDPRKRRASIKEVNILKNEDYLVFEYNRLVNSTQTSVVFTGIPLKFISLIKELGFLVPYIPKRTHSFVIVEETHAIADELYTFSYLRFDQ